MTIFRTQREVQTREEAGENCRGGPWKSVTLGEQQKSDDRAHQVFGGGMHGRSCDVNQGDLSAARPGAGRSQSIHSSVEAE